VHVIADLGKSHNKEKHDLLKLQHQMRQKNVTDAVASSASVPTHQKTSSHFMWDLLRRYKTNHVQSTLPARTHDNASPDPRIWKLGPLTLDPQAWHRFRFALGHHLVKHNASPYNEEAAHKLTVHSAVTALFHKVEHPTLPVDPLFCEDITLQELVGEIKNFNSDKSPGDDGIANRMIQAAGLNLQRSFMKCSACYGYMISNQQRGKCPLCSQSTKVVTNLRLTQPHIVAYI